MSETVPEPEDGGFPPTRQTLLSRLRDWNDSESWQEFFEAYWRVIYRTGRKAGLTDAEAQDLVQETVVSVAKAMPTFKYDPKLGSFKHWLRQLSGWRIQDQFRKRHPDQSAGLSSRGEGVRTATIERVADPAGPALDALWDHEWETNLVETAMKRIKSRVDPRHYQIFDLHVFKGWPVSKVTSTLGVNRGHVYLIKHRISMLLKRELQGLRAARR